LADVTQFVVEKWGAGKNEEQENHRQLNRDDDVVEARGLADADHSSQVAATITTTSGTLRMAPVDDQAR
jgi:hypothetical protein